MKSSAKEHWANFEMIKFWVEGRKEGIKFLDLQCDVSTEPLNLAK